MSDWKDDTDWYREQSGKRRLMCATCNTEVFGGICDCMPDNAMTEPQKSEADFTAINDALNEAPVPTKNRYGVDRDGNVKQFTDENGKPKTEPNNIDPKAVKVLNEFAENKLPNNLEWIDELLDLHLQNIKAGHKDKLKLVITSKINEIEKQTELNVLTQLKIDYMHHTLTEHPRDWIPIANYIDNRIAELRKRKDEVLK